MIMICGILGVLLIVLGVTILYQSRRRANRWQKWHYVDVQICAFETFRQMEAWLAEHHMKYVADALDVTEVRFYFKQPNDAILFGLRWG